MPLAPGDKLTCPVTGTPNGATVLAVEDDGLLTVACHGGKRTGIPDPTVV